jgi:glycosyltransferase involved in cell wall biosynthesis
VVLLHVGRLAAEKNLPALLAAYEKAGPAKLVLVGDGPMRRELQARYPDVVFAGTRSGEDLAAHYASGDVFLFPSLTETWGNVTLEAMASGLAVVAFDYAAAAEVVRHGHTGLLAPYGDTETFISQSVALAADPARVRRMGSAARAEAAGRGWDCVVRELEAVLYAAADAGRAALKHGAPGRGSDAEAAVHQVA